MSESNRAEAKRPWGPAGSPGGALFLLVAFVSLYLLWPSLAEVFTQWRSLTSFEPQWFAVALGVEALSFVAIWELQRIALQTKRWFPVGTSQLAGNAFGRIIPGGVAAAGALQYRMLDPRRASPGAPDRLRAHRGLRAPLRRRARAPAPEPARDHRRNAGRDGPRPRGVPGRRRVRPRCSSEAPRVRLGPAARASSGGRSSGCSTRRCGASNHVTGPAERAPAERDSLRTPSAALEGRRRSPPAGKWILDYLALVACLRAVGAEPNPSLVLLAFVAGVLPRDDPAHAGRARLRGGGPDRPARPGGRLAGRRRRGDARLPARLVLAADPGRRHRLSAASATATPESERRRRREARARRPRVRARRPAARTPRPER